MQVVELEQVCRSYLVGKNHIQAVDNINLSIGLGEFVVIKGMSGSGKTTLLNLIGTIDEPTSGTVKVAERSIAELSDAQTSRLRSQKIGFIFQSFNLIPVLTAVENVAYPLVLQGEKNSRKLALEALDKVGLLEFSAHRPNQLSGGQMQRVAIARAVVTNPKLILADEPTANLDSENSVQIMNLLAELNQNLGITFVFATHHDFVLTRASRIIQMRDGKIVSDKFINNKRSLAMPADYLVETSI